MKPQRARLCTVGTCHNLAKPGSNRCEEHRRESRPNSAQRGYTKGAAWQQVRALVLRRDPICTWPEGCESPSTVADHWPETRKQLLAEGVPDPDAPHRLRGLCHSHHSRHTALTSPGGWALR